MQALLRALEHLVHPAGPVFPAHAGKLVASPQPPAALRPQGGERGNQGSWNSEPRAPRVSWGDAL